MTDPTTLLALFAVGVVAAIFDAIAGGGGLLTLPALLIAGLDPVAAIATNKLQSSGGSVSATVVFARRGLIQWPLAWAYAAGAFVAAILGALSVALLPRDLLKAMVPVVLIGVALYFILARRPSDVDARSRMMPLAFAATFVPTIGFYDGIFGPGAGSFYMIGFVTLLGYGITKGDGAYQAVQCREQPRRSPALRRHRQDRLAGRPRDGRRRRARRADRLTTGDPPRRPDHPPAARHDLLYHGDQVVGGSHESVTIGCGGPVSRKIGRRARSIHVH